VYAIRRVYVNQGGFKLNCTHQLVIYADDVIILGRSICTMKESIKASVVASKEIGLAVSSDEIKYMVMSQEQNAG
jgi:pyrimidine operon attenuation protein/uracil phosphoribosyltransferase